MRREAYVLAYIDGFWIIVWMKSLTASPKQFLSDWRGMEENMRKIDIANPERVGVATAKTTILLLGLACLSALWIGMPARAGQIKTVFVIALENHNWTQPVSQHAPGSILGNPNAPYINSLVQRGNPSAAQVSYASNYLNAVHMDLRALISPQLTALAIIYKDQGRYGDHIRRISTLM